jgi:RimJ/RimL family protein N-acetyltransferase
MSSDVRLRDGTAVRVRPVRSDDAARLVAFHERLSPESQRLRFFGPHPHLSAAEVERFVNVDGQRRVALVAERDDDIVAVARFDRREGSDDAEVAFVVQDSWQRRGLGPALLERLAARALETGVSRLVAQTLPENVPMLRVFRRFSPEVTTHFIGGVIEVAIPLSPSRG